MENPRIIILRGRETDPGVNKYCKSLSKEQYRVTLLMWNRRGSVINTNPPGYSLHQFFFPAPLDKFSAVFFYPIWWMYTTYFLLKEKPDIVHACDFDTLLPVLFIKRFIRCQFVYTIFDFYADNIQDGHFSPVRKILKKIVRSLEIRGINCSDLLILVDESRLEEIKGARVKNLIYIYNTPEDQAFSQNQEIHQSKGSFSIFYAGYLINDRGITDIITAISDIPDVHLILAGPVVDKNILDDIAAHPTRVQYIGWVPSYGEILKKTLSADMLFRFSDTALPTKNKYASPNKLFEAMMCGKPILVSDQSSMATIVRNNKCGLVVPYGDVGAMKDAILKLMNNPRLREELGKNGRKAYEEKYSWTIMENRLVAAYKNLRQ
jgi:glycosyltransferase involved in cell wall biosynthesis